MWKETMYGSADHLFSVLLFFVYVCLSLWKMYFYVSKIIISTL